MCVYVHVYVYMDSPANFSHTLRRTYAVKRHVERATSVVYTAANWTTIIPSTCFYFYCLTLWRKCSTLFPASILISTYENPTQPRRPDWISTFISYSFPLFWGLYVLHIQCQFLLTLYFSGLCFFLDSRTAKYSCSCCALNKVARLRMEIGAEIYLTSFALEGAHFLMYIKKQCMLPALLLRLTSPWAQELDYEHLCVSPAFWPLIAGPLIACRHQM